MPNRRRLQADRMRTANPFSPSKRWVESDVECDTGTGVSAPDGVAQAPSDFVEACHRLVGMLMTFAQQDFLVCGHTPAMYALARLSGQFIDIDAQPMVRAVLTGNLEDEWALTPEDLGMDEANQVFMDLAGSCGIAEMVDGAEAQISIRVTNDVWIPTEGATPEGVQFLKQMPREHQLLVAGALPIWVAEFLSPGPRWYARSSHPVQGLWIQPAPLITAAVVDILNVRPPRQIVAI